MPKYFGGLKKKSYLCTRLETISASHTKRVQGFASLAQLARARDL